MNAATTLLEVGARAPDLDAADALHLNESPSLSSEARLLAFFPRDWDPARRYLLAQYREAIASLPGSPRLTGVSSGGRRWHFHIAAEADDVELVHVPCDGPTASRFGIHSQDALFLIDEKGFCRWRQSGTLTSRHGMRELLAICRSAARTPVTRRTFLLGAMTLALAMTIAPKALAAPSSVGTDGARRLAATHRLVRLHLNGQEVALPLDARTTLLDALREELGLTGTKKGCDHGQCGACTVLINDRRVKSCLMLAMQAEGDRITSIEGLADPDGRLHPVQAAFVEHDGLQCGYCTPGQIMSAVACIREGHADSDAEIQDWMSGNICRCGAYVGIRAAILDAAARLGAQR